MSARDQEVYQIIYQSTASDNLTQEDVDGIVIWSKKNNTAKGISGFLIYEKGRFMQLLEGDEKLVKDLYYNKIAKDTRHKDSKVVKEGHGRRTCAEWSMSQLPIGAFTANLKK